MNTAAGIKSEHSFGFQTGLTKRQLTPRVILAFGP
jgi:hypothetical protein